MGKLMGLSTLFSAVQLTENPENISAETPISTEKIGGKTRISYIKWFIWEKSEQPPGSGLFLLRLVVSLLGVIYFELRAICHSLQFVFLSFK